MNLLNNILGKKSSTPTPQQETKISNAHPIKPKGKEVPINEKEDENIKIFGENKSYTFNLKVYGKSIFQNMILTANATAQNEVIPIKCIWKRVKHETVIYIKDINSNSYIPTAEDIGYIIEVEAHLVDNTTEPPAFGQYGPITLDNDMKSTVELLLASGGTKFSCYVFDINEQEKVQNREIIIYINTSELKLVETDYNGHEKVLEQVKYHQSNPIIKLHPYDSTRFSLKFFEYGFECEAGNRDVKDIDNLSQTVKSEYHLISLSKQCRELIYLLIQFFLIDEKMKNGKLFCSVNYNSLPQETKVGVTDLISEIKTLREENNIVMSNMKYLEIAHRKLNEDMKNLEEDFQITLEMINASDLGIQEDIERNTREGKTPQVNTALNNTSNYFDLKGKYDELRELNTSLSAREKALREENKELVLQVEIFKNCNTELNAEIKKLKMAVTENESELTTVKKSFAAANSSKAQIQKELENVASENKKLNDNIKQVTTSNELDTLKSKFSEVQKLNETLSYDNKNLILQRNLLTNQKNDIQKEFEKLKNEKNTNDEKIAALNQTISSLQANLIEMENSKNYLSISNEKLKKENTELKNKIEVLEIEYKTVKDNYDKMFEQNNMLNMSINGTNVKISPDEYEEYDQLRKDKDEFEALIMQLKSNNEAKDVEIRNLNMLINNLKLEKK